MEVVLPCLQENKEFYFISPQRTTLLLQCMLSCTPRSSSCFFQGHQHDIVLTLFMFSPPAATVRVEEDVITASILLIINIPVNCTTEEATVRAM